MKKILYLDVDNTICNSTKRFVEIYNQEYNQQADWTKCYKWDLSDICPLVKARLEECTLQEKIFIMTNLN